MVYVYPHPPTGWRRPTRTSPRRPRSWCVRDASCRFGCDAAAADPNPSGNGFANASCRCRKGCARSYRNRAWRASNRAAHRPTDGSTARRNRLRRSACRCGRAVGPRLRSKRFHETLDRAARWRSQARSPAPNLRSAAPGRAAKSSPRRGAQKFRNGGRARPIANDSPGHVWSRSDSAGGAGRSSCATVR